MGLFSFLFKPKRQHKVTGTLSYIPGSQNVTNEGTIELHNGELIKRKYVQPNEQDKQESTSIPIYTGNPFRDTRKPEIEEGPQSGDF